MTEHTKLPWRVVKKGNKPFVEQYEVRDGETLWGLIVADCGMTDEGQENAAFIVKACNAHDALVKALQEIERDLSSPDRATVNEHNAFEHFSKLNKLLVGVRGKARAALATPSHPSAGERQA